MTLSVYTGFYLQLIVY